jgi:hypothetical protein
LKAHSLPFLGLLVFVFGPRFAKDWGKCISKVWMDSPHRTLVFVAAVHAVVANIITKPGSKGPNSFGGK